MPYAAGEKPRTGVALLAFISKFVLQESWRDGMLKGLMALRAPDPDEHSSATITLLLNNLFGRFWRMRLEMKT